MENTQKKGMSKGCLIGIIIAAVLLVILIIGIFLVYHFKDDIGKFGAVTLADSVKKELAKNPLEGVDTVKVDAVVDAFVTRVKADTTDNLVTISAFMQTVQAVIKDQKITADEVDKAMDAMIDVYPDLDTIWRPYMPDSTATEDSTRDSLTTE